MAVLIRRLRAESNWHGLSWSQLAVTARLEMVGSSTIADLARAEAVKPQSMGATLSSLEEAGLVRRSSDPDDGRRVIFTLTAKGRKSRADASAAKQKWLAETLQGLAPGEQRTMLAAISIMKRLAASQDYPR